MDRIEAERNNIKGELEKEVSRKLEEKTKQSLMEKLTNSTGKLQENINVLQEIANNELRKYTSLCSFDTFTSNTDT